MSIKYRVFPVLVLLALLSVAMLHVQAVRADPEASPAGADNAVGTQPPPTNGTPPSVADDIPSDDNETTGACQTEEPVDLLTGNRWLRQMDLLVPTPGVALTFSRRYNSVESDREGPLGKGWFHGLDWRLCAAVEVIDDLTVVRERSDSIPASDFTLSGGSGSSGSWAEVPPSPDPEDYRVTVTLIDNTNFVYVFGHDYLDAGPGSTVIKTTSDIRITDLTYVGAASREPPPVQIRMGHAFYAHALARVLPLPVGAPSIDSVIESISVEPEGFGVERQTTTNRWLEVDSGGGRRTRLHAQGDAYVSQDSPWHIYREGSDYVLVTPGGIERVFAEGGRLRQLRDFAGNSITLTYHNGTLMQAEHSNGMTMDFTYNGSRLVSVTVSPELGLDFTYNGNGQLASVVRHDSGQSVTSRYAYTDGYMTGYVNPLGETSTYFYESEDGSLTYRSTGMHLEEDWIPEEITYHDPDTRTVVYPARGQNPQYTYKFAPHTRVLTYRHGPGEDAVDASRRGTRYYYTEAEPVFTNTAFIPILPLLSETRYFDDAVGESFSVLTERDSRRLPTKKSVAYGDRDNAVLLTQKQWDSHSLQLLETSDPAGGRTRIEYTNHVPLRIQEYYSETGSHTTHLTHEGGLLTAIANAAGHVTAFGYDASGYLASVTPPAGPSQRLVNNAYGYPLQTELLPAGSTNGTGASTASAAMPAGGLIP